jgi:hypothetical protein
MVIKYPYYIHGNISNGLLIGRLPRENFDVSKGNWEFCITSATFHLKEEVTDTVIGISTNLLRGYTSKVNEREMELTVIGTDKLAGTIDSVIACSNFSNNYHSFNQGEGVLELRFINLATGDLSNKNIEAYLTLSFHKVDQ